MSGPSPGDRKALGLIGIARRAGRAAVGADAIRSASRKGRVFAIVVARDASDNAIARVGGLARETETVRLGSREELGRAVGKGVAALVGLTDRELAARVVAAARPAKPEADREDGSNERAREA